jgi:hypothetical protein
LVYVVLTEDDEQITLTPAEFEQRYGWKNDPSKVRLLPEPEGEQQPEQAENSPGETDQAATESDS